MADLKLSLEEVAEVMSPTLIEQALKKLVGLPLRSLGRTTNMLRLQFGEMREMPAFGGGTRTVGEWDINVQCAWRICRRGQIEVAYRDYYYSPEGDALDDDWDRAGKSRFDHLAQILNGVLDAISPRVLSVTPDDVGGFSLSLSHDYRLDVFPGETSRDNSSEHWRLFEPGSDREHFVVPSDGTPELH